MGSSMDPQLVKHFWKEEAKKKPCYVGQMYYWSLKKDGWYGYIEMRQGKIIPKIFTRTHKEIITVKQHIEEHRLEWQQIFDGANVKSGRLIMEVRDFYDKCTNVYEINSILKKEKIQQQCSYWVHDLIDYNKNESAEDRMTKLHSGFIWNNPQIGNIRFLKPDLVTSNITKAIEYYKTVVSVGEEGIVGKACKSFYEPGKRNGNLLKMKAEVVIKNCVIIKRLPGLGNGSLLVRLPSGIEAQVAGITEKQNHLWNVKEPVGEKVHIACMQITPSGKLREPRLWEIL
jgi:hypothetical protein